MPGATATKVGQMSVDQRAVAPFLCSGSFSDYQEETMRAVRKNDKSITLVEGARRCRLPYAAAYRLALLGEWRSQQISGRWMVRSVDVEKWVRKR